MKALAYLLGARAMDVAGNAASVERRLPEPPLGPLATTPETASAWRRWAQAGDVTAAAADLRPSRVRARSETGTTPA
jgi:hypothetical protein